ncbi:MAG: tetratricopeptide repeat protein, partial [Bacteroidota bacterium]
MSIDEIAQKIYERQKVNFTLYEAEIDKCQNDIKALAIDHTSKESWSEKIEKIKKDQRHLAFLYTLILLKCFPNERAIILLSSTLAININNYTYAIKVLSALKERTTSDHPSFTDILYLLAKSHRNANFFDDAVVYYRLAQDSYRERGDTLNESWMIYSIGKMYLNYLQQPSKSIDLLLQAKQKFEGIGTDDKKKDRGISACLDELGDVYRQGLKDYNRAIETYNEAIEFNKNPKHYYPAGLSRNYCHLGTCYKYLNNLIDAEGYLKKGIEILYSLPGQEKGLGIRLTQLGNIQIESKLYELGFKNLTQGQSYNIL